MAVRDLYSQILLCLGSLLGMLFWFSPHTLFAFDYTSSNFILRDPVFFMSGGIGTSSSFELYSASDLFVLGEGTSTTFTGRSGFFYYPFVSSPVVTATAGTGQVALSWSAASGLLGWTVSDYNVGQATVSGGPYTYTSVGSTTSSTRTGLTAGTTYYFVIVAEDAFGNHIATSSQVSATPTAAASSGSGGSSGGSSGGGGGGGGGGIVSSGTKVLIKGRAYPGAAITVLRDGALAGTPMADILGNWQLEVEAAGGIYTFSVYSTDKQNVRSLLTSFTSSVVKGQTTTISDVIISPTIIADKSEVKHGNDIKFFGYSYPESQVSIVVNSENTILDATKSDKFGFWTYLLNSRTLERGDHTSKTQTVTPEKLKSPFSESLAFRVGDVDVPFGKPSQLSLPPGSCAKNGDINGDKKVNIIDFSILLYFWNQRNPKNACADINRDGLVNISDFSIMLFWWTG